MRHADRFDPATCHANALRFSEARFDRELKALVAQKKAAFDKRCLAGHAQTPDPVRPAFAQDDAKYDLAAVGE
jgi:hypothetical protein